MVLESCEGARLVLETRLKTMVAFIAVMDTDMLMVWEIAAMGTALVRSGLGLGLGLCDGTTLVPGFVLVMARLCG